MTENNTRFRQDDKQKEEKPKFEVSVTTVKDVIFSFIKQILSIGQIDYQATLEAIKKDMVFRGHTAWILMFSILIASIGLNANSTAVIIGAMLISPLMGPIVAIGTAIGIHDGEMLKKALRYLGVAVFISLFTSTLYFLLTPLKEAHSELIARTKPTFLDVLIALFGGFAGAIVGAKREKSNVVPGVAIATALMPPLCTAGYGLATAQWNFFFGALYLFFINSVFISIATLITVKYLKFPPKTFVDPKREKRIKRQITIFAIIVIIPSTFIFLNVITETRFKTTAETFIKKETSKLKESNLIDKKILYDNDTAVIELYFIGKPVSADEIENLQKKLKQYNLVSNGSFLKKLFLPDTTILKIYQAKDNTEMFQKQLENLDATLRQKIKTDILEDLYKKNEELLKDKEKRIKFLENELLKIKSDTFPVRQIAKEMSVEYDKIVKFAFAKSVQFVNDTTIDTIPILIVRWKPGYSYYYRRKEDQKLAKWLKYRLNLDTLIVIESKF